MAIKNDHWADESLKPVLITVKRVNWTERSSAGDRSVRHKRLILKAASVVLAALFMTGCTRAGIYQGYFKNSNLHMASPYPTPVPPELILWFEGQRGQDTYLLDSNGDPVTDGQVSMWRDVRWRSPGQHYRARAIAPDLQGIVDSLPVNGREPDKWPQMVPTLNCSSVHRCYYVIESDDDNHRPLSLNGLNYAIFAVVFSSFDRNDNYFIVSSGNHSCTSINLQPFGPGMSCATKGGEMIRVGLSGRSAVFAQGFPSTDLITLPGPSSDPADLNYFPDNTHGLFLFVTRLDSNVQPPNGDGQPIQNHIQELAVLGPGMNALNTTGVTDSPLFAPQGSGPLAIGGVLPDTDSMLADGSCPRCAIPAPDWRFSGNIVALLVYSYRGSLNPDAVLFAEDYLRNRYGPR